MASPLHLVVISLFLGCLAWAATATTDGGLDLEVVNASKQQQQQHATKGILWSSSILTIYLLALIAVKLSLSLVNRFLFARRARALGCSTSVPVYPHKEPILGLDSFVENLLALRGHRLLRLFTERFLKYGNTYYIISLGRWQLMTAEPENIKTILGTKMEDWPIAGPRLLTVLPVLGPNSVFTANGQAWHDARAMIRPSFVRDQIADLECFDRHITNLLAAVPRDGSTFDMQKLLLAMTMDSSTDFMLGYSTNSLTKASPEAQQFLRDFEYAARESAKSGLLGMLYFYLPRRELTASVKRLRAFILGYLRRAVAEKDRKGSAKDRNYVFLDEVLKLNASEDHTIDQILSIIIAGRDTTAVATAAVFYYLARSPAVVERVREEIREVGEEKPTWEQLKGMKYLNNVVKEGLRLFPPVSSNSRAANKETILPRGGGPDGKQPILVPKGTPIRWSLISMQRRKDIFGPDAEEFRPERWDEGLRVGWEYIPFHGGPRICIGQQFALTQMLYTLYKFFSTFKSIEAREHGPFLTRSSLTSSFANGCMVSVTPEKM
ncbi:cytochrome P450 [Bombardia bombarda]|uniref:Cytochrome P450 n=1 Tax=Bombardia bombarda TaxID=252184 RepID=A0AA40C7U3_9PEZI|nr:cytochrome P450 [Bombardia bombarda]